MPDEALLKNEGRFFKTMAFAPGASIGEHTHDGNIALYVVLAGNGFATDDGVEHPVSAGDVLYTTDGGTHASATRERAISLCSTACCWKIVPQNECTHATNVVY